jgi:hypothetical protein
VRPIGEQRAKGRKVLGTPPALCARAWVGMGAINAEGRAGRHRCRLDARKPGLAGPGNRKGLHIRLGKSVCSTTINSRASGAVRLQMALQLQLNLSPASSSIVGTVIPAGDPCPRCRGGFLTVGSSKGPHSAELRCAGCAMFRGWMPAALYQRFVTGLSTAGSL